jgi:hypothetical protein
MRRLFGFYRVSCASFVRVTRAARPLRRRSVNRYLRALTKSLRHIVHVNHLINCLVVSY